MASLSERGSCFTAGDDGTQALIYSSGDRPYLLIITMFFIIDSNYGHRSIHNEKNPN